MVKKEDLLIEMELLRDCLDDYINNGFNEDSYMVLNHHLIDTQNAMRGYFTRFPIKYEVTIVEDKNNQVNAIQVGTSFCYEPKQDTHTQKAFKK